MRLLLFRGDTTQLSGYSRTRIKLESEGGSVSTTNKLVAISITFFVLGYGWLFAALFFVLGLVGIRLRKSWRNSNSAVLPGYGRGSAALQWRGLSA
jgi:hypothetical protein